MYKGESFIPGEHYITLGISYIIHTEFQPPHLTSYVNHINLINNYVTYFADKGYTFALLIVFTL